MIEVSDVVHISSSPVVSQDLVLYRKWIDLNEVCAHEFMIILNNIREEDYRHNASAFKLIYINFANSQKISL